VLLAVAGAWHALAPTAVAARGRRTGPAGLALLLGCAACWVGYLRWAAAAGPVDALSTTTATTSLGALICGASLAIEAGGLAAPGGRPGSAWLSLTPWPWAPPPWPMPGTCRA
jgi:hypothetical protein